MESAQSLKRRLKSVKNIGQITKAMELVAATKMRKSQEIALNSRPYSYAALELLAMLTKQDTYLPELLKSRSVKKTLLVLVTSDKGLAGSFNSLVIRNFERYLKEKNINPKQENYCFIAIGKKAANYLQNKGLDTAEKFVRVGDFTKPEETRPIADFISDGYLTKRWDAVIVFSTYFKSALKQEVLARKLFPVKLASIKKTLEEIIPQTGKFSNFINEKQAVSLSGKADEYLVEPSAKTILNILAKHLVAMQFYHLVLETNASEHAARRMAMKNASDNAKELSENLSLIYNKSRQSGITREITEIVSSIIS